MSKLNPNTNPFRSFEEVRKEMGDTGSDSFGFLSHVLGWSVFAAILVVFVAPVLAAPVAAAMWTWAALPAGGMDFLGGSVAFLVLALVEAGAMWFSRGWVRTFVVFLLGLSWVGGLYLVLTAVPSGYDFTTPPPVHAPGVAAGLLMALAIFIYMGLYTLLLKAITHPKVHKSLRWGWLVPKAKPKH